MKKLILFLGLTFGALSINAQTATNFNVNDCNGVNHDLFTELNAGKVIVICWVMPCSACAGPALSAHNIVQSYSVSNPGQVLMYLCDDFGTTSCATLNNWATANGLSIYTPFTNSLISMSDYGSNGMPKTVVLGGANHTVYFNQNNALNASTFSTAINNALAGSSTGLAQNAQINLENSVSPNPLSNELNFSYYSAASGNIKAEVYNLLGQKVLSSDVHVEAGNNAVKLNVNELSNGNYFLKINQNNASETIKFIIAY